MDQNRIIQKTQEAKAKGFVNGAEVYPIHYPSRKDKQLGDGVFHKPGYNFLWVRVNSSLGFEMDCPIYDFNQDKWAQFKAPIKVVAKVAEFKSALQFKKGDYVKCEGFNGTLVKYPSNKEITIETNEGLKVVNKDQILTVISKGQ